MKKVVINQDSIIVEEEKKKIFGGVNIIRKEFSLDDIISVGKVQENGNFFALDIILKNNEEINLSNDEVDLISILNDLKDVSNNWKRFKLDIVEL